MIQFDLNLLRIFDTLMELRSVTQTATRLGLTQSAISHALRRLRDAIGDPLFVRGPHGLHPTSRAIEMAAGVRDGLFRLESAFTPVHFDPATAARRLRIAAGAYFCAHLVPALIDTVRAEAPGIALHIVPDQEDPVAALDDNSVDIALGGFSSVPARLGIEHLYDEELVWIAAAGHPLAGARMPLASIARVPRVVTIARGSRPELGVVSAEAWLREQVLAAGEDDPAFAAGACWVYSSQTAAAVVATTDLVALVPRRAAAGSDQVAIIETDQPTPPVPISMLWHMKQRDDPALRWLRGKLRESVAG